MSTTISLDLSVSIFDPSSTEGTPVSVPIITLMASPNPSSISRSDGGEREDEDEHQVSQVRQPLVIREDSTRTKNGIKKGEKTQAGGIECPVSACESSQSSEATQKLQAAATLRAPPIVVCQDLSATAPIFVPAGQSPIPATPAVISRGLSATAPIFIPNGQNTVPYLLCVAETNKSLRREECLDQILEQFDLARQVEMDARRQHFEYGLDWI
ncbi:hypothetical protein DL98DRAFT_630930 [Cadophora sp. DSE1049]|nr:hypothetical protein DL98DRAFT_630930 [Cadophora sp. DSE1049]